MSKWSERAKVHFSEKSQVGTPITPETHLMGVLGVGSGRTHGNEAQVLGVLGAPPPRIPEKRSSLAQSLISVGMKVCDLYKDSDAAREDMRIQLAEVPDEQHQELLDHFKAAYGVWL